MTTATARRSTLVGVLVVIVVVVAVVVAALVLVTDRNDPQSGSVSSPASTAAAGALVAGLNYPDLATAFVAGATSDIVAVTSYDYRYLDTALSTGDSVTTGAYQRAYRAALTGPLAASAKRQHRVQDFELDAAAIGEMSTDGTSAKVLIFGTQSVTDDTTGGTSRTAAVTLTATMQRSGSQFLISRLDAGANAGLPPGSAALSVAAEAAREEVAGLLTFRRAHFDADFATVLHGAVDPLRSRLSSQSSAKRAQLTRGGYDLSGAVTAIGVERASGDTVVLLVAATGTRIDSTGTSSVVTDGRYEVTVVRVGGRWFTSEVNPVMAG